jgi:hypothetical protein
MAAAAQRAFIEQIQVARGDNALLLARGDAGEQFYRDGVNITVELLADARQRYALANAILIASPMSF